jgi:hypothetical protein
MLKKEHTMKMEKQNKAVEAFNQGIADEDNNVRSVRRLTIPVNVRDFYDSARAQRAKQLEPARSEQRKKDNIEAKKSNDKIMKMLNDLSIAFMSNDDKKVNAVCDKYMGF